MFHTTFRPGRSEPGLDFLDRFLATGAWHPASGTPSPVFPFEPPELWNGSTSTRSTLPRLAAKSAIADFVQVVGPARARARSAPRPGRRSAASRRANRVDGLRVLAGQAMVQVRRHGLEAEHDQVDGAQVFVAEPVAEEAIGVERRVHSNFLHGGKHLEHESVLHQCLAAADRQAALHGAAGRGDTGSPLPPPAPRYRHAVGHLPGVRIVADTRTGTGNRLSQATRRTPGPSTAEPVVNE